MITLRSSTTVVSAVLITVIFLISIPGALAALRERA